MKAMKEGYCLLHDTFAKMTMFTLDLTAFILLQLVVAPIIIREIRRTVEEFVPLTKILWPENPDDPGPPAKRPCESCPYKPADNAAPRLFIVRIKN